jgi:acetyl-CoA carboxylase biotin carboxylase subunit
MSLRRVFIANRGEIAVRVIRACHALGLEAVLGVSTADRDSLGAQLADRAVCLGPARPGDSYLSVAAVVQAAIGTGCDALHPGYGFLAERADLVRACEQNGIAFVGPTAESIEAMGNKLVARNLAREAGVPILAGSDHVATPQAAEALVDQLGLPLMLKASAGGGGRGMRIVREPGDIRSAFDSASAEARDAFDDSTLYAERYLEGARHVEIQVVGDGQGRIVHLGERDCSVQRRHQKLVEEAPSPALDERLRSAMAESAVRLAERVHYRGAGTVEFIFDPLREDFSFLEMNTRIQVEHPVTEMVCGVDLVAEQLKIAGGAPLSIVQDGVRTDGHAIEFRINAEDPHRNFAPSPGRITAWEMPEGGGIRVDTHCYEGTFVPPFYDSLLAKLIVWGSTRDKALERSERALDAFVVDGVSTTIPFHQALLRETDFRAARVTTRWVEEHYREGALA